MTFLRYTFILMILAPSLAAAQAHPFTVDDMLQLEEIGKVRFDPRGHQLLFERYGPYQDQADFSRSLVVGGLRSNIYIMHLSNDEVPQQLFDQRSDVSYTLDGFSPDGKRAIYDALSMEEGLKKGVARMDSHQGTILELNPDYIRWADTPWVDGHLAVAVLGEGQTPAMIGRFAEARDDLVNDWHAARNGERATASPIGSGRFADIRTRGERLTLVDPNSAEMRTLAKGVFRERLVSPVNTAVAALREEQLKVDPEILINHAANTGSIKRSLLVFDFSGDATSSFLPCETCDVLRNSLQWSPDGRFLAFVAREEDKSWSAASYRIFDLESGRTTNVDIDDYAPYADYSNFYLRIQAAWLGDSLAVLMVPSSDADEQQEGDEEPRPDWFLVGEDENVNLTVEFKEDPPEVIATTKNELIMLHKGEAWAVNSSGDRRQLTESIETPIQEWAPPSDYGGAARPAFELVQTITLQTTDEDGDGETTLLFLNIADGSIDRVETGSQTARIVAVSSASRRIAFIDSSLGLTRLVVGSADGERRQIISINGHLKNVAGGTPVRIDYQGPDGEDRISWLLLPPGWEPGDSPLATVVNIYPGRVGRETFQRFKLDQVHALNDHILAAHGYAVLFPSFPVEYHQVPRDPLEGLVEDVFAAVDAAAAQGYVDAERLGIQGQSYGGYATGALIGLTDRFKAAVAQAGLYNLTSAYGMMDVRSRPTQEYEGLDFFAASWAETSQGGMGGPVWEDPERYWRNSPLMHVEHIKTPVMLTHGDYDFASITQSEEFFTALSRLNKDAVFVRYFGEGHVFASPANIRDMWDRIFDWYELHLGPPNDKTP